MKDFLEFKKMITPIIVPILFWVGTIGCIIVGIVLIVMGTTSGMRSGEMVLMGFVYLLLGPIVVRVCCEFVLILFSINDKLTDIKEALERQRDNDNGNRALDEK